MNILTISNKKDLEIILMEEILITHDELQRDKEIYCNMWCIGLSEFASPSLAINDVVNFLKQLIKKRQGDIQKNLMLGPITFYLWFDDLALQLRFNFLSGYIKKLPFGCKLHVVDDPHEIVERFFKMRSWDDLGLVKIDHLSEEELAKLEEATPENKILTVFCTYIY